MSRRKLTRRQFVAATALSSAALVTAPFVRTARAAGSLSIGFWDHWVPGANKASTDLVNEWAEKEKVEVQIDYITSNGRKNEKKNNNREISRHFRFGSPGRNANVTEKAHSSSVRCSYRLVFCGAR